MMPTKGFENKMIFRHLAGVQGAFAPLLRRREVDAPKWMIQMNASGLTFLFKVPVMNRAPGCSLSVGGGSNKPRDQVGPQKRSSI